MTRNILLGTSLLLSFLMFVTVFFKTNSSNNAEWLSRHQIDNMPLVEDDPYAAIAYGGAPEEQRGPEVRKWLAPGLKIRVSGASGSGTIVYYNPEDGYAYVQSCGHLWNGNMSAEEGLRKKLTCKVITWYHNEEKLSGEREYPAEVLYYSNDRGRDVSLLRFRPDWKPNYFPIAPEDYRFREGMHFHSVGCDGGREIAHYDVIYVGMKDGGGSEWPDLVTTKNSPRPGRSGGGLTSSDGYYVGICWGTSDFNGGGNGFFTPLKTIRHYNERNGYGWLNDIGHSLARKIPIMDRNNPQGSYPRDYIPLPNR